ncbi:MAG: methyltransferase domain-containing protein [Chloroflexi bacterium]|nr:methyltransferase domain-containing protein [Chloroflexota bacterium]
MGVEDRTEFKVADARDLPFEDDLFDAVIVESVNVFFKDKHRAMDEYVRVTKPGGYVGITEMTWLNPPTPEVAAYYLRTVYADTLEVDDWKELLESAGLKDVVANAYEMDMRAEGKDRINRYGCRGSIKAMFKALAVVFKDPSSREFMKNACSSIPKDMLGDMGYGVYAGRKE